MGLSPPPSRSLPSPSRSLPSPSRSLPSPLPALSPPPPALSPLPLPLSPLPLPLWRCSITSEGCVHLSTVLSQESSLTHLDLGLNHIGVVGLRALCGALKAPPCGLQCLWLWGCSLTPFSCKDLSSALSSNRSLVTLDLGQNTLGFEGIKLLCEALRLQQCPLRTLRLKINESDVHLQNLLQEVRKSNPQLTIDSSRQDPGKSRPSADDFLF
uniref:Uncharacterized protein n=1 Tax=Sciurus vulgaris TaxID=55149 RepID=A0A8D2JQL1_SCIVU